MSLSLCCSWHTGYSAVLYQHWVKKTLPCTLHNLMHAHTQWWAGVSLQEHVSMHVWGTEKKRDVVLHIYSKFNWVWTVLMEAKATVDKFVLKNLFAHLSISASDCQPFAHNLPCETLLEGEIWHWFRPSKIYHTARLAHFHAQSRPHTHWGMHSKITELTYGPPLCCSHTIQADSCNST